MGKDDEDFMGWQHVAYEDGSNPYICKTKAELEKLRAKYGDRMCQVGDGQWAVKAAPGPLDTDGPLF